MFPNRQLPRAADSGKGVLSSVIERDPAAVRVSIKHHYLSSTGSVGIDDRLGVSAPIHAGTDGARHSHSPATAELNFTHLYWLFFFFLLSFELILVLVNIMVNNVFE